MTSNQYILLIFLVLFLISCSSTLGVAYMSGLNHNVCALIPEWNMVVVRMGDDKNPPEGKYVVWNEFLRLLGEALYK